MGLWYSFLLSMEADAYFFLPPILNMGKYSNQFDQSPGIPKWWIFFNPFFVCLPIVFRKTHFPYFHWRHLGPYLRSATQKRNTKKIILCLPSIVLWIVLCLNLINTIVSVKTVFEAKSTQHEKQLNLFSIGRHFYPINICWVSNFKLIIFNFKKIQKQSVWNF